MKLVAFDVRQTLEKSVGELVGEVDPKRETAFGLIKQAGIPLSDRALVGAGAKEIIQYFEEEVDEEKEQIERDLYNLFFGAVSVVSNGISLNFRSTRSFEQMLSGLLRLTQPQMDSIVSLDLSSTRIMSRELPFEKFRNLEILIVDSTAVRDGFLEKISGLKKLRVLSLAETKISDDGLNSLVGLPNLEELSLAGTPITGKAVPTLARIRSLRKINVIRTDINPMLLTPFIGEVNGIRSA